jgi:hypothetical protein
MVARIYAEVPKALHPVAAQSVESHLKKLGKEKRVTETVQPNATSRWTFLG